MFTRASVIGSKEFRLGNWEDTISNVKMIIFFHLATVVD